MGEEVTIREQLKKFAIKSLLGFQTVLVYGLGRRLGIFDNLHQMGLKSENPLNVDKLSFNLEELSKTLSIKYEYLKNWMEMAVKCGIFEIDSTKEQTIITGPFIYTLLIDRDADFYIGDLLGGFYYTGPVQEKMLECFRNGNKIGFSEVSSEWVNDAQKMSAFEANKMLNHFNSTYKKNKRLLRKGGKILEIGSGYGYTLLNLAKNYKHAKIVGIDPNSIAIKSSLELIKNSNFSEKIIVEAITIGELAQNSSDNFDLILLNHVLHEMDSDIEYRRTQMNLIYGLLDENGILLLNENMISPLFHPNFSQTSYAFVMHKWFETILPSKFYEQEELREFLESTKFKDIKLEKNGSDSYWVIKKGNL